MFTIILADLLKYWCVLLAGCSLCLARLYNHLEIQKRVPLQKISESARKSTDNEQKLKYSKKCVNIIELFQIID